MVLFARRVVTMIESTGDPGSAMKIAVGILSAVYAVTFFCGALLHLGVRIPLGAAVLAAHAFAFGGVLLGVTALALGADPSTDLNTMYHRVMLVGLVAVLALLLTPAGRAAFRREA